MFAFIPLRFLTNPDFLSLPNTSISFSQGLLFPPFESLSTFYCYVLLLVFSSFYWYFSVPSPIFAKLPCFSVLYPLLSSSVCFCILMYWTLPACFHRNILPPKDFSIFFFFEKIHTKGKKKITKSNKPTIKKKNHPKTKSKTHFQHTSGKVMTKDPFFFSFWVYILQQHTIYEVIPLNCVHRPHCPFKKPFKFPGYWLYSQEVYHLLLFVGLLGFFCCLFTSFLCLLNVVLSPEIVVFCVWKTSIGWWCK